MIADEHLECSDICALRSTCLILQQKTSRAFSRTFPKIGTDLSPNSLRRLQEMSKHELIKDQLKTLVIYDTFRSKPLEPVWLEHTTCCGENFSWNRDMLGHLVPPFPAISMLHELLLNKFKNCRSFWIIAFGHDNCGTDNCLAPYDVITLLFHLLPSTKIQPKSLHFIYIVGEGLDITGLKLPPAAPFFAPWSQLEDLSLNHSNHQEIATWTMGLLRHTPNLKRLALEFEFTNDDGAFMNEFSTSMAPIYPNLEKLSLNSFYISESCLMKIFSSCKDTIRILDLRCIMIPSGSGTWESTFTEMASKLTNLETLSIICPGSDFSHAICFPKLEKDKIVPGTDGQKYASVPRLKCTGGLAVVRTHNQFMDLLYMERTFFLWKDVEIVGVKYRGPFMSEVLTRLAEATDYLVDEDDDQVFDDGFRAFDYDI